VLAFDARKGGTVRHNMVLLGIVLGCWAIHQKDGREVILIWGMNSIALAGGAAGVARAGKARRWVNGFYLTIPPPM